MKIIDLIKNNKLYNLANYDKIKSEMGKFEGQYVEISISSVKRERSLSQNSYYWGVVLPMITEEVAGKEQGRVDEEIVQQVHEEMKIRFLSFEVESLVDKSKLTFTKATKELSTSEFESYLEQIRRFAKNELGINIPLPNEI